MVGRGRGTDKEGEVGIDKKTHTCLADMLPSSVQGDHTTGYFHVRVRNPPARACGVGSVQPWGCITSNGIPALGGAFCVE